MSDSKDAVRRRVCDLALKLATVAQEADAHPGEFFTALAMTYIGSFVAARTAAGQEVEERDLVVAIQVFNEQLCDQAQFLLNFQPETLKNEMEAEALCQEGTSQA